MPRVLVLNNFAAEKDWAKVRRHERPDHLLYGINYFQARGYDVELMPFRQSPFWKWLDDTLAKTRLTPLLGCLEQEWRAWRRRHACDLIYAPNQVQTYLLCYLRSLGFLRVPIVCLAHHPILWGRFAGWRAPWMKRAIKGTDAFPSLTRKVAEEINALAGNPAKSWPVPWGPDAAYYPQSTGEGTGIVAAGRTGRDFETLALAASRTKVATRIICHRDVAPSRADRFAANVWLDIQSEEEALNYVKLCEIFLQARVLAVPLAPGVSLSGLTGLLDALGMGKPVIMTRHPLVDIDIEAEGIGKWVEYGDVTGWAEAIDWFDTHPTEAIEMGRRARRLVDNGLDSRAYADQIINAFDTVLGRG